MVRGGTIRGGTRAERETEEMHRHRQARSKVVGYLGAEWSTNAQRQAHGDLTVIEHCSCGATRRRHVNGVHEHVEPWREKGEGDD